MSIIFGLALAASAATAGSAAPDDAIVVEGIRSPAKQASRYVDELLPAAVDGQFGRYEDPVCPKVIGLPAKLEAEVVDRIRDVARAAQIDVASAGCSPNLLLIVIADKQAMIDGMKKQHPMYLYGVGSDRLKRLARSSRPFAAWQVRDVIGADGVPLRIDGNGYPRLWTTLAPSRMRSMTRPRVLGSVVIVETRALRSVSTRQLADFALVRGLMPADVSDQDPPATSVLSLFNPGVTAEEGPQSLTWWDLAFLKSLKAAPVDEYASFQRKAIRDQMVREMAKIPSEER